MVCIFCQIYKKTPCCFTGVEHASLFSVAKHWFTRDFRNNIQGSEAKKRKSTRLSELLCGCEAYQSPELSGNVCNVRVITSTGKWSGPYMPHTMPSHSLFPPSLSNLPKDKSNLVFAQEHCQQRTLKEKAKPVHLWSNLNTLTWLFARLNEWAIHYLILLPLQDCSLQYILQRFVQSGFKTSKWWDFHQFTWGSDFTG